MAILASCARCATISPSNDYPCPDFYKKKKEKKKKPIKEKEEEKEEKESLNPKFR